ncbi:MAG: WecB/TagA/CpsF family glycosyltransferase [Deltaproteobacteria bacterium]|nr:WecB/TagA/CpsF family glycosyltransferase [Deltaproteobacteria bacterium]
MENTQGDTEAPDAPVKAPAALHAPFRSILGMRVDCTRYDEAVESITAMSGEARPSYVCVATVHMVMEAWDDAGYREVVNGAQLVTSDGVPLVWALRLLGLPDAERVYGPTLTPLLCERAAREGIPVGFYGGSPEVLGVVCERLQARYPGLDIAFRYSPPFRALSPGEEAELTGSIEDSGARILFVGLGCPKQERWMAAQGGSLSCTMVGVGAAFDFIAGAKAQAPAWLQRRGLEWLFRLACEPRRLWRRYLYNNPRFLYAFARQLWRERAGWHSHA